MSRVVMLTFVHCDGEQLVLHIFTCSGSIKETQVDAWRVVEISHNFSGSCLVFLELVAFEGEEKDRRDT